MKFFSVKEVSKKGLNNKDGLGILPISRDNVYKKIEHGKWRLGRHFLRDERSTIFFTEDTVNNIMKDLYHAG